MDKYNLINYGNYLKHLIQFEMFDTFPRLDENEEKVRDNVIVDKKYDKKQLKTFYDFLKKKYVNFPQLGYFDYETLNEYYTALNVLSKSKEKFRTKFNLLQMLHSYFIRDKEISYENFEMNFKAKFEMNLQNEWSTCTLDDKFLSQYENKILFDLMMYNSELFTSQLIVNVSVFNENINQNVQNWFINRRNLTHLVITINGKENLTEWENSFMKILIESLKQLKQLKCLILIHKNGIHKLNYKNAFNFMKFIQNSQNLQILLIDSFHFTSQYELVEAVTQNKNLRYVTFQNVNVNFMTKEKIISRYPSKDNLCLIRFNDDAVYDALSE